MMERNNKERRPRSLIVALGLLILTIGVNIAGGVSIMNAGKAALEDARQDLELDTIARSRALEAELAGDYAGFLKLTGEKSKIMVVAGACNYR